MIPTPYHVPAALILLAGGLLACFAGYRLFRLVLGIFGFIAGALLATSLVSSSSTMALAIAGLVGGLIGALVLTLAYFLGVALVGAGLGLLVAHAVWAQPAGAAPHAAALLICAAVGAIAALVFQRYVIIAGTAFGGAWTALVGALAMSGDPAARHAADATSVWIVHPFNPTIDRPWLMGAWLVLSVAGFFTQARTGHAKKP